ncbi:ABC transporter ATP-binding protein [uncultured Sphaerochaeta sp.]|uniref:ABC transporter ATP-binding protein n=1 Tax=uncultured Sphaerochaeta sp. TaxID=886478 RepID=UPI002A0A6D61|nr:ABC transporter ATP-binding protein [uncultured Sphaerochaeta sp.]
MIIRIQNISKRFGSTIVLDSLDLEFDSGKLTTLLGHSGCGKTTLLRCIAGLEVPDAGEIYFDEQCVFSSSRQINVPSEQRNLGFVFQDFALWPHMTVFENVAFGLRAHKDTRNLSKKVNQALQAVGLQQYGQRYPHELSGGQQQRVAFARAIAVTPSCILFDEPLSALDTLLREQMQQELRTLITERNLTAIFVTHDQREAMSISDTIVVMKDGQVEMRGTPQEVYRYPCSGFVAKFLGPVNWFDKEHLIRPEELLLRDTPIAKTSLALPVLACTYQGNCYRVQTEHQGKPWLVMTSKPFKAGEKLTVYFDERQIIALKEKNA